MILVNYIFQRVNRDLAKKSQAGYSAVSEFNGDLMDSEGILYDFYIKEFEESQKIGDALAPFLKEVNRTITAGFATYPDDYRHELEMAYNFVDSTCETVKSAELPMRKLHANEERDTVASPIRKPSLAEKRLYWLQTNAKIKVLPKDLSGEVILKYFRHPVYGVYKSRVNTTTQQEEFDPPPASINLEWPEQERNNIIDLMLLHKGIAIRDSDLIQFAQLKMATK